MSEQQFEAQTAQRHLIAALGSRPGRNRRSCRERGAADRRYRAARAAARGARSSSSPASSSRRQVKVDADAVEGLLRGDHKAEFELPEKVRAEYVMLSPRRSQNAVESRQGAAGRDSAVVEHSNAEARRAKPMQSRRARRGAEGRRQIAGRAAQGSPGALRRAREEELARIPAPRAAGRRPRLVRRAARWSSRSTTPCSR